MSTWATLDAEVIGKHADEPAATHLEQVLRCSVDLATGDVGVDVETRSVAVHASRLYERTVLTPEAARRYAALLLDAAAKADHYR